MRFLNLFFVSTLLLPGCTNCLEDLDRQGVKIQNQIDAKSENQMRANGLLGAGERPLAYYDTTMSLDGTESYLVTNLALKHYQRGMIHEIALSEIESVQHQDAGIGGDRIIASSPSRKLVLEIAPLNDGPLFLSELRQQVARARRN